MRTKAGPCLVKYPPKSFECKIITDIFGGDLKFTSQGCFSNHLTSKTSPLSPLPRPKQHCRALFFGFNTNLELNVHNGHLYLLFLMRKAILVEFDTQHRNTRSSQNAKCRFLDNLKYFEIF